MRRSISAGLLFALLLGCGPSFDFHGVWVGDRGYKPKTGEDPGLVGTVSQIHIEVHQDGTFSAVDSGIPIDGTASSQGATLHLRPTRILGRPAEMAGPPVSNERLLKLSTDGSADYWRGGDTVHIRMRRTTN